MTRLVVGGERRPSLAGQHPAAVRAATFIEQHLERNWRLEELAALCGISKAHLLVVFRSVTGCTPRQFLLGRRLEVADELLRNTRRPITQIAIDLGFSSSQHFATTYLKWRGLWPGKTRAMADRLRSGLQRRAARVRKDR